MTAAHWLLLAATVAALGWLWWTRRNPRVRAWDVERDGPPGRCWSALDLVPRRMRTWPVLRRWYWQADELAEARRRARDMRQWADEPGDPTHEQIDQALDVVSERDHAIAEHTDKAMRRLEHTVPWPHLTAEEAADCTLCTPTGPPLREKGGDER